MGTERTQRRRGRPGGGDDGAKERERSAGQSLDGETYDRDDPVREEATRDDEVRFPSPIAYVYRGGG
jgi:hypothetical protein